MTKLYKKDVNGRIRSWEIIPDYDTGELCIVHGLENGAKQEKFEYIEEGKAGRTLDEQVELRMQSRINRQTDKGYVDSIEKARTSPVTNSLGFLKPMLASPIKNVRGIDYGRAFVQHKFDGHRCLITKQNGKIIAYSRNGKPVESISHIIQGVNIPEGMTIDGELYKHGVPLQTLGSWIRRKQEKTKELSYRVYDVIMPLPFYERIQFLRTLELGDHAKVVQTIKIPDHETAMKAFAQARRTGYEGVIVRWGDEGYQDDKRSKHLVKIKGIMDIELPVIDIIQSSDGWAILVCQLQNGSTLKVTAPGTMQDKYKVWKERELYIGRDVTVEFSQYTKEGIPFHPVATRWREDI